MKYDVLTKKSILDALNIELEAYIAYTKSSKTNSDITEAHRNGYRSGLEKAIELIKSY
jgi:hypothetical protein